MRTNLVDSRQVSGRLLAFYTFQMGTFGVMLGAVCGGAMGLLFAVVGALVTLPLGAILGGAVGLLDGVLLGLLAIGEIHSGVPTEKIGLHARRATPLVTAFVGAIVLLTIGCLEGAPLLWFAFPLADVCWLLAILASWQASILIERRFRDQFGA